MKEKNNRKYIIGVGHPRCGTGYTASLLQKLGLDTGHEHYGSNGIVSWMAASCRSIVPWGQGVPFIEPDFQCFTIARSPINAIPSMVPEAYNLRSFGFRAQVIWEELQVDVTNAQILPQTNLGYSLGMWALWMNIALRRCPDHVFRVDRNEDLPLLAKYLGVGLPTSLTNINQNSRPSLRRNEFDINMFALFPQQLAALTLEMCLKLGYEAEHAKLIAIYDQHT